MPANSDGSGNAFTVNGNYPGGNKKNRNIRRYKKRDTVAGMVQLSVTITHMV